MKTQVGGTWMWLTALRRVQIGFGYARDWTTLQMKMNTVIVRTITRISREQSHSLVIDGYLTKSVPPLSQRTQDILLSASLLYTWELQRLLNFRATLELLGDVPFTRSFSSAETETLGALQTSFIHSALQDNTNRLRYLSTMLALLLPGMEWTSSGCAAFTSQSHHHTKQSTSAGTLSTLLCSSIILSSAQEIQSLIGWKK